MAHGRYHPCAIQQDPMKANLTNLFMALLAVVGLVACETDLERAQLNESAVPVVTVSSQNVVLTRDKADADALTVSFSKPDYGFNAAASYTIQMDKKGANFANAQTVALGNGLTRTFKASELNGLLIKLGLTPGTAADVDLRVISALGATTSLTSAVSTLKVTPYLERLDLSTNWGVVGSATANGWDGPDQPFYKSTANASELVAYVTLKGGDIKFRQDNKWDVNLGGSNGTLTQGGANITVKAGTYRITFNPTANTYKIEPYSWGIVGDATANGWNGPDQPLTYDPTTDQWKATVTLKAGQIKFRQNNAWDVNYGGSAGKLVQAGDNITVTAGTYVITADFKADKLTYSIEPK